MTGIPERELSILLLSSRYDLSPFDSGDAELNDFLKNDALREQKEFLSKTHLCFYRDRVAGFISMAADSVQIKKDKLDPSQIIDDCEYPVYPCILIARLAVDKKLHGYGIGSYLLSLAVGYAMESPLGCRYLAVDPKDGAVAFYEKIGFRFWTKSQHRMFLNLRDISEQMQMNESLDLWTRNDESESK
ncbi:MAG: GNAT family N-acetyltransferase [Methanothrix sp.]|nr:GNAT family N-acetyltransferase [Methanothrix sp.]